jgi:hypothetical protein
MDMAASLAGENSSKTEPIHQPLWYLLQIVPRMGGRYGNDKADLGTLMVILNASPSSLHRDDCGLWVLRGARGNISTRDDGASWQLVVFELPTARQWNFRRDVLAAFAEVTEDTDTDGCLLLRRLPTVDEADVIRDILGIGKMPEELLVQRKLARTPSGCR